MMVDTQIISYSYKGYGKGNLNHSICSVVANEFLEVYDTSPTKARYYIPNIRMLGAWHAPMVIMGAGPRRDHPFHQRHTDRIIIDFNNEYPSIIEYGSRAVSALIEARFPQAFYNIISFMPKKDRKKLSDRFNFLCSNVEECIPINAEISDIAVDMLDAFTRKHNLKKSFRNSFNDILILSTAISRGDALSTNDDELKRFSAERYGGKIVGSGEKIAIDFSRPVISKKIYSRESKGYINRGWRIAVETARGV